MVRFINYDGRWPCLCMGTLTIKVNKKTYKLDHLLISGGSCGFKNNYTESYIEKGPWTIDEHALPEELVKYADEITRLVNENVPDGCCGGCL